MKLCRLFKELALREISVFSLIDKKCRKNYKTYNENGQILRLSNCTGCGIEIPLKNTFCLQCKIPRKVYDKKRYQANRHRILEVFTPVDNSPLVRPKNKV